MNNRIKEKIKEIENYLSELEDIIPSSFKDYKELKTKAACERYFEKIIEAVVDLAFLTIKDKNLKIPEEDKEAFDILKDENLISKELSEKLKEVKGMRNLIAHDYGIIDDEIVFESITQELEKDVNEFIKKIKNEKMKNLELKARAYALKNALTYGGKAQQGAVISALFNEGLKKEEVGKYIKKISEIVSIVNKLSVSEQEKEFKKFEKEVSERDEREGLSELPDVDKKKGVVMRFRPAPSGPLHVGHIISNMISSLYVKKYGGKFLIIIDDTDPETTLLESYGNIKKDCDWIFGNVTEYINSSDRMDLYYGYAVSLIEKDKAYVCTCSQEKFKKFSENKKDCPCRKKSVKENFKDWEKMINKKGFEEGEAVLRFKSSMKESNPAMRDFPLARINKKTHLIQKNKYRVWPLMNLVVAVDDMDLEMTHIIRGKDHMDNAKRQKMIFDVFNKDFPWTFFMGRIKFKDLVLSKRKITAAIKAGEFDGADDEKLPTISSLKKKGYKPEAFVKFAEHRGLTDVDKVMESKDFFKILDTFNK